MLTMEYTVYLPPSTNHNFCVISFAILHAVIIIRCILSTKTCFSNFIRDPR